MVIRSLLVRFARSSKLTFLCVLPLILGQKRDKVNMIREGQPWFFSLLKTFLWNKNDIGCQKITPESWKYALIVTPLKAEFCDYHGTNSLTFTLSNQNSNQGATKRGRERTSRFESLEATERVTKRALKEQWKERAKEQCKEAQS